MSHKSPKNALPVAFDLEEHRFPDLVARAYLKVIEKAQDIVQETLTTP